MSLMNVDLEQLNAGSNYKFSATKIDKLGASEYTIASIIQDVSDSVSPYASQLENTIKSVFKSMSKSPRKENLMLRLTSFNHSLKEIHGFKLLDTIKESDYDNVLCVGGSTALFDAVDEAIQTTSAYGKQLNSQNFLTNAIIVIITDGQNNTGNIMDPVKVKKTLDAVKQTENLESITVILVGLTSDINVDTYLQDIVNKVGITQYISVGECSPNKLAKLAKFISQSVSSSSTALGTGKPSQTINSFTF